jgi:hypothetical protein
MDLNASTATRPPEFDAARVAPELAAAVAPPPPARRPWSRVALHYLRRGHLYCGLLLLPWALLYGVTAFLFNHPTVFSDRPTASFGREELAGTPMDAPPPPDQVAAQVVAALRERTGSTSYALVQPAQARYADGFAFARVRADGADVSVLMRVDGSGGRVRSRLPPAGSGEPAPFAVAGRNEDGPPGEPEDRPRAGGGLSIEQPLHQRIEAAVPAVLARVGFPSGEVTVTSVPDLVFLLSDGQRIWQVKYNALAGSVAGETDVQPEMSARQFLTRLHLAHGYPGQLGVPWLWAVVVDAMACVLLFWGVSGLCMWWQIKATRWPGLAVLVTSAVAATWIGVEMFGALAAGS